MQLKNDKKNNLIVAGVNAFCAAFMFFFAVKQGEWFLAVVGVAFLFVCAERLSRFKKLLDAEKQGQETQAQEVPGEKDQ